MANLSTYDDIISQVKDLFDDASAGANTTIRRLVAPVLWDIYRRKKWKFARKETTVATVASAESYTLASDYDFGGMVSVVNDTANTRVSYISDDDFDRMYPDGSASGSPTLYRLWNISSNTQQISFYPIPSAVETITYKYYRKPTVVDLSTNTDNDDETPDLPQQYRELIVLGVLIELFKKDESQLANVNEVKYENMLKRMEQQYADEPDIVHILRSEEERSGSSLPTVQFPSNYGPTVDLY